MAKDYAKFVPVKSAKPSRKLRLTALFIAIFFAIIVSVAGGYALLISHNKLAFTAQNAKVNTVIAKAIALLHYNKKSLGGDTDDSIPPPVHFNFYTELPNRQLKVAQTLPTDKTANQEASYSIRLKSTLAMPKEVEKPVVTDAPMVASAPIFTHDDISTRMAEDVSQQYVIQLGSFESESAANKLQAALANVGFEPRIVTSNQGDVLFYQVQQGPYPSIKSAKIAQSRLKKRGIPGIIRKLA
jgi:cell division protein FtsN